MDIAFWFANISMEDTTKIPCSVDNFRRRNPSYFLNLKKSVILIFENRLVNTRVMYPIIIYKRLYDLIIPRIVIYILANMLREGITFKEMLFI